MPRSTQSLGAYRQEFESATNRMDRVAVLTAAVVYASALYSAFTSDAAKIKNRKVWYLPHFVWVAAALYRHLGLVERMVRSTVSNPAFEDVWTLDRLETLSAVCGKFGMQFTWLGKSELFRHAAWRLLSKAADIETRLGKQAFKPGGHTQALLDVTRMLLTLAHPEESPLCNVSRRAIESDVRIRLQRPGWLRMVDEIADPNQKARVLRGIGKVYDELGDQLTARAWYLRSLQVPGITKQTEEKTEVCL